MHNNYNYAEVAHWKKDSVML